MMRGEGRLEDRLNGVAEQLRAIAVEARSQDAAVFLDSTAELVEKFARNSGE